MSLAPIALFIFKRPEHTRRTIQSLMACPEFHSSKVFVFCDGPRNDSELKEVKAARLVAREALGESADFFEAKTNRGLANSIISGVTLLCNSHGRVIVLEDDLEVAPTFLTFMNMALDRYAHNNRIMQVSGYMFPVPSLRERRKALFLPFTASWGWGTWQRAWQLFDSEATEWKQLLHDSTLRNRFNVGQRDYFSMLKQQMEGKIDSWAIRWYWSVFKKDGLVLYPAGSLVVNSGFDGSGTHGWIGARMSAVNSVVDFKNQTFPDSEEINVEDLQCVADFLAATRPPSKGILGIVGFAYRYLKRLLFPQTRL